MSKRVLKDLHKEFLIVDKKAVHSLFASLRHLLEKNERGMEIIKKLKRRLYAG